MKKITKSITLIALLMACLAIPSLGNAQVVKNMYYNLDWQLNTPFSQTFADKTSGWGAHAEAGYYVGSNLSVGLFISYHTNNKYVERQTLSVNPTSVITSDQQHSLFQLPFGAAFRYTFNREGMFEPYVGVQLGANYSDLSTSMNVLKVYDRTWGFYASPEVGLSIYCTPDKKFGVHVAAYYNHATNKAQVLSYEVDGLDNWGLRLGAAF